ncbi:MAG: ribonuclease P protein component 1 [Candidatus Bathyarchaeia archaeon]
MSPVDSSNVLRHELVGLRLRVVKSRNRTSLGLKGKVLDETRNTLLVGTSKGSRRVLKKGATFEFTLRDGGSMRVDGELLLGRPEDRLVKG